MKLLVNSLALFTLSILSGVSYGQAVTVDDPGFETPVVGGGLGGIQQYDYNSSTTTYLNGTSGWYVTPPAGSSSGAGSVTLVNQGLLGVLLSPISGDSPGQYIALNGLVINALQLTPGANGGVSQSMATTLNQDYLVTYQAGALSLALGTTGSQVFTATVDNNSTVSNPVNGGALVNVSVGTFTDQSFTFTATGTTSILDFSEPNALIANVGGVAIDNVTVTAVPEPSHSTLILLGAVMAFYFYRRFYTANVPEEQVPVKI